MTDKKEFFKFELLKKDAASGARLGRFHTPHGIVETPAFMPVGTAASVKAVLPSTLEGIGCQILLSNTYHLYLRPGHRTVEKAGGLHKFMNWDRPILTDSGGFQVFSLAGLRKIKEEGVYFNSHVDGRKIFMGPEESMQIQSNLGSTIAMAFDECPSSVADRDYVQKSVERTTRWLARCKTEMARLNSLPDTINKEQLLFGINQGAIYEDIRIEHAKEIAKMDNQFHLAITKMVGNEILYTINDYISKFTLPSRLKTTEENIKNDTIQNYYVLHKKIYRLLEEKNVSMIEQIIKEHYIYWENTSIDE